MRLWTVQPKEVLDIINETGVFRCTQEKSANGEDFKDAYVWMMQQMHEKGIKRPEGVDLPIWAWHTHYWKHQKPDLRYIGLGNPGEESYCIEIEIPDDQVLLSDFDAWHFVLNNSYLHMELTDEEWEKTDEWFDRLPAAERESIKRESWQGIFDVEPFWNGFLAKGQFVQAVFWELKKENIIKIKKFIGK